MRTIAVVGSGAVGMYYGGRLAAAGEDVKFLVRSGRDEILRDGVTVESVAGDFRLAHPQLFSPGKVVGGVDLVIVAWKATANAHYEEVIAPLLHDSTAILTLQNGLGNTERLAELFGGERVLGGLCFVCINRMGPSLVRHLAKGLITIGEFQEGLSKRVEDLAQRMREAGIECRAEEDLVEAQWKKLVWNIPFNGLCISDGGVTTEELLSRPEGEEEVRALMLEVIEGARALGKTIPHAMIDEQIRATYEMGGYRPSSMIDYVEGREVEIGAIWEEPLRRARAAGVELPRLSMLLKGIKRRLAARG